MARRRAKWALIIALLIAPVVFAWGVIRAALAGGCTELFVAKLGGWCLLVESVALVACVPVILALMRPDAGATLSRLADAGRGTPMFDRFTDRARKVMGYARQEAERFHHDHIGTGHVLLGIVKEGSGVAAVVLENFDIDTEKVRAEVERMVGQGSAECLGQLPFDKDARRALDSAWGAARELGHKYIGTEHLLLGLLRVEGSIAAQALMSLGLSLENVRGEVTELLGGPGGPLEPGVGLLAAEPTLAPRVIRAIHYAVEEARKAGAPFTNIVHLRAGLGRAERESGEKST